VCVQVDEAGRNDEPRCIDPSPALRGIDRRGRDQRDAVTLDGDIGPTPRCSTAVDYRTAGDDQVITRRLSERRRRYRDRGDNQKDKISAQGTPPSDLGWRELIV